MAINTAVNIDISVDGTSTVNQAAEAYEDLGDAVSKTQVEAERLAQQFGINDPRTKEAIRLAGRYKGELEQLDFAIDAAKGGSDQLFRASQGIVGGFEAAAGAISIFGSESEELEKIMLKVQGAMVLSMGLKDLNEFLPAIRNIAAEITGPLIRAFYKFGFVARTIIASTGIGLLIAATSTLIEYWDDLVRLFNKGNKEFKLTSDIIENISNEVAPLIDNTKKLTKAVQDNTKSENERRMKLDELNKVYKQYGIRQVNDINDTAKLNANKERLIKILIAEAKVRAAEGKITEETKNFLDETLELQEKDIELKEKVTEANRKLIKNSTEYNKALKEEEKRTGYTPLFRQDDFTRVQKNYQVALNASEKANKSYDENQKAIERVNEEYEKSIAPIKNFIEEQNNIKESLQDVNPELETYNEGLTKTIDELLRKQQELAKQRELIDKDEFDKRRILIERQFQQNVEGFKQENQAYQDAVAIRDAELQKINDEEIKKKSEQRKAEKEKIKQRNQEIINEEEKLQDLLLSIEIEKLKALGQSYDADLLLIEDRYAKEIAAAEGNKAKILLIEKRKQIELNQLRDKYEDITTQNIQSVFENRQTQDDARKAVELRREEIFQQKLADSYSAINNMASAAQQFVTNSSEQLDQDFQNRIERLKDLGYTEEQIADMRDKELIKIDERAKKAFELEKALRYTQTILSTIEGVQNAFTTANKSPITAIFPAYPYVQAGAAAAFGVAQLQQIKQSQYQSKMLPKTTSPEGAASSPGVPQTNAPQLGGRLITDNELTGERKVYVVESDITTTQKRVDNAKKVSLVE